MIRKLQKVMEKSSKRRINISIRRIKGIRKTKRKRRVRKTKNERESTEGLMKRRKSS